MARRSRLGSKGDPVMPTDFAIVVLPEDLARLCDTARVLVEAIETDGDAIFVAAACAWTIGESGYEVPQGGWIDVPEEHRREVERLFVAARKQQRGPDYHDARHAPQPASRPLKQYAPVRYTPGRRST
jgi:hypothetical protein